MATTRGQKELENENIGQTCLNKFDCDIVSKLLDNFSGDHCFVLANKYLTPDLISLFKNKELKESIDALFKCNLNVNEASKQIFMHRNTLLHRIDKIESLTGLNLKKFDDAVALLVLEAIYNKTKDLL